MKRRLVKLIAAGGFVSLIADNIKDNLVSDSD